MRAEIGTEIGERGHRCGTHAQQSKDNTVMGPCPGAGFVNPYFSNVRETDKASDLIAQPRRRWSGKIFTGAQGVGRRRIPRWLTTWIFKIAGMVNFFEAMIYDCIRGGRGFPRGFQAAARRFRRDEKVVGSSTKTVGRAKTVKIAPNSYREIIHFATRNFWVRSNERWSRVKDSCKM
ncbi:hypothetical protein KM043_012493 [Ampulex compressa]|nr:hypothetical protein KM043_012493 [Ampulex compressa]